MRTRRSQRRPPASPRREEMLMLHRRRQGSLGFAAKEALKELKSLPNKDGVYTLDLGHAHWFTVVARHLCEGIARLYTPAVSVATASVEVIMKDYGKIYKGQKRDYPYKALDRVTYMLQRGVTLKELNCVRTLLRRLVKEFPYHKYHRFAF